MSIYLKKMAFHVDLHLTNFYVNGSIKVNIIFIALVVSTDGEVRNAYAHKDAYMIPRHCC